MSARRLREDFALRDRAPVFADRTAAGRHLASMLEDYCASGALIAAIPAGGVPVAAEMALHLDLELELLPVSKILLPWNTESGFGAVACDGSSWVNEAAVRRLGLSPDAVTRSTDEARSKVARRQSLLRGGRALRIPRGRTVLVTDDGIAAGSTMRVAVSALRSLGAEKVVVAVPTGHAASVEAIAGMADETWCANVRTGLSFAVADAYERWHDLNDREIVKLLDGLRGPDRGG